MTLAEDFDAIDLSAIGRWISEHQAEHLQLDFKRANTTNLRDAADQKNYAKALAGFANASGGMIVWGVATKKDRDRGTELADHAAEIPDADALVAALNEFAGVHAMPRVEGVRHKAIFTDRPRGFVVTLIPESDTGPHMAKADVNRYIRRHGDQFQPMEHFEVADMFGRRQQPSLSISHRVRGDGTRGGSGGTVRFVAVEFSLHNEGRASATAPYVEITNWPRISEGIRPFGVSESSGLMTLIRQAGRVVLSGSSNLLLHPGASFPFATMRLDYDDGELTGKRFFGFEMQARLAAANWPIRDARISIPRDVIAQTLGFAVD